MSFIIQDLERSFTEYIDSNLSTQTGEVIKYEFPISSLGSHTYSFHFINHTPIPLAHRAIEGGSSGREIESLLQFDVFRLPTSGGQPDKAGANKMLSRFSDLFKATHYIPFKSYGSNPTASTVGTVRNGSIRVNEGEVARESYDPNPLIRRYSQAVTLKKKEVF